MLCLSLFLVRSIQHLAWSFTGIRLGVKRSDIARIGVTAFVAMLIVAIVTGSIRINISKKTFGYQITEST